MSVKFGVAFDGSEQGQRALQRCLMVAKSGEDEIHLIHAIDPPRTDPPFGMFLEEAEKVIEDRKQHATKLLEPIVADLEKRNLKYKVHIQSGDPRTFITFVSDEEKLDFMFLGSRGLSALKGFLMGSTSQYCRGSGTKIQFISARDRGGLMELAHAKCWSRGNLKMSTKAPITTKSTTPIAFDREWAMASGNCIVRGGNTLKYTSNTTKTYSFRANGFFSYNDDPNTASLPYVEYTISKMSPKSIICIGFCTDQYKNNSFLPGHVQNTLAFFNNGTFCRNKKVPVEAGMKFGEGDVVGIGVAFDSFNGWFPFTTLNGTLTGHWSNLRHISKGMNLYPIVGFSGTELEMTINFGMSPKLPLRAAEILPTLRKFPSKENYIDALPKEIVALIVAEAAMVSKDVAALTLPRVCRAWSEYSSVNDVWRHHYLKVWYNQNRNLAVKDWKKFFKRRWALVTGDKSKGHRRNIEEIENCHFEFSCPLAWQALEFVSETERFCDKCSRTVYAVEMDEQLQQHVALGHCVAIKNAMRGIEFLGEIDESFYNGLEVPVTNLLESDEENF